MRNRIINIIKNIGPEFDIKKIRKDMLENFPFCINIDSMIWIYGGYISLIFGQCSKNLDNWHAFVVSRWKLQNTHPLDSLHPATSEIHNNIRLTTFNPRDIPDEVLADVIEKLKQAKEDGKLQNFLYS